MHGYITRKYILSGEKYTLKIVYIFNICQSLSQMGNCVDMTQVTSGLDPKNTSRMIKPLLTPDKQDPLRKMKERDVRTYGYPTASTIMGADILF